MLSAKPTMPRPVAELSVTMLQTAHDDLDAAIAALSHGGPCDELLITRLKKRKLHLKDAIAWASAAQGPVARTG